MKGMWQRTELLIVKVIRIAVSPRFDHHAYQILLVQVVKTSSPSHCKWANWFYHSVSRVLWLFNSYYRKPVMFLHAFGIVFTENSSEENIYLSLPIHITFLRQRSFFLKAISVSTTFLPSLMTKKAWPSLITRKKNAIIIPTLPRKHIELHHAVNPPLECFLAIYPSANVLPSVFPSTTRGGKYLFILLQISLNKTQLQYFVKMLVSEHLKFRCCGWKTVTLKKKE